jgi:hypothetical protein
MEWFSSERLYENTEKYLNGTEFRAGSLSPCSFRSAVGTYLKTDWEIGAEDDKSLTHGYREVSASCWGHVSPG